MSEEAQQAAGFLKYLPHVITGLITLALNSLMTLFWIRPTDRKYQSKVYLYQNLIVKDVEKYVDHANKIYEAFIKLCDSIVANPGQKRTIIETAQDGIDALDRQITTDVILKSGLFDDKFVQQAESLWTEYYDAATLTISKLDASGVKQDVFHRLGSEIKNAKEKYLKNTFNLIKKFHPPVR
jgi:hypothetical protein